MAEMNDAESRTSPTLYHSFKCDCGCWVRSDSFEQLEKFANKHSRKCHLPSVQTTQTVPIDIPELSE